VCACALIASCMRAGVWRAAGVCLASCVRARLNRPAGKSWRTLLSTSKSPNILPRRTLQLFIVIIIIIIFIIIIIIIIIIICLNTLVIAGKFRDD
jgi:hypothetical protein